MAAFWIVATLMTVVAMVFVLAPLLRSRPRATPTRFDANLEALRGQRRELEADVANGLLTPAARDEALVELVARADDDLAARESAVPAAARRPWITAAIAAVAIPAIAFGFYAATGNPAATDAKLVAAARQSPDDTQIVAMVESLAAKVREHPDDSRGWALLARSMAALGRFQESADAYQHLATLVPGDADVLADYADALGMAQGRTLAGRPAELVKQALQIDPKHKKALALAGTAALDQGDFAAATAHWELLATLLPADSADRTQVQSILNEIRTRAAAGGKPLPAGPATPAQAASMPVAKAPVASDVLGSISVAPAMASRITGDETLFIFARAEGGPRVPLAVIRASARELPRSFALDDTQSMAPGVKISTATALRVEARVSKSGNAMPQPGDLVGASAVVKPGARDVKVVVDRVLP